MTDGIGVIFDVDGVLIDSYQSHFESWRKLAEEIGRPCTEAEFAICCVVEDAPPGIQAAHAAGMVCVGFASTGRTHVELQDAECIVDSLDELTLPGISQLIHAGLRTRSPINQE